MNKLINQLAFSLCQQSNVEDCTVDELHTLTKQYPYYPAIQILYTAKLKASKSNEYQPALQKTSLFFDSPLWLDSLFSESKQVETVLTETDQPEITNYEDFNNDELVVENPRPEVFNILPALKEKLAAITNPEITEVKETSIAFDPYHTVDYFASQGIKNQLEEKPTDRFGLQLKSFTDWLKTLKTTIPQENTSISDFSSEEKVVNLAVHSIEDRNVVTEAMAEVWIKQGQPEKAIAIYDKLSLLNPSKSSYFASLIENLKKN